jgi:hypothetical protein
LLCSNLKHWSRPFSRLHSPTLVWCAIFRTKVKGIFIASTIINSVEIQTSNESPHLKVREHSHMLRLILCLLNRFLIRFWLPKATNPNHARQRLLTLDIFFLLSLDSAENSKDYANKKAAKCKEQISAEIEGQKLKLAKEQK